MLELYPTDGCLATRENIIRWMRDNRDFSLGKGGKGPFLNREQLLQRGIQYVEICTYEIPLTVVEK